VEEIGHNPVRQMAGILTASLTHSTSCSSVFCWQVLKGK